MEFPNDTIVPIFSFIKLKNPKYFNLPLIIQASVLQMHWNIRDIFPSSTILILIKEGGCKILKDMLKCLLYLSVLLEKAKSWFRFEFFCIISFHDNFEKITYQFQFAYLGFASHSTTKTNKIILGRLSTAPNLSYIRGTCQNEMCQNLAWS